MKHSSMLIAVLVIVLSGAQVSSTLAWGRDIGSSKKKAVKSATAAAEAAKPASAPEKPAAGDKELLIANINNMRNQELRVAILQQLLNEELAKLRNVQAVFCDQYELDIEKFRQGLYRYDEAQGKFIEQEQPAAQPQQ